MILGLTSPTSFTLASLNVLQTEVVDTFVSAYETFAKGIVSGVHCRPKSFGKLSSITFPKLHACKHFCDAIANLGFVWNWNTGECALAALKWCSPRIQFGVGASTCYVWECLVEPDRILGGHQQDTERHLQANHRLHKLEAHRDGAESQLFSQVPLPGK